GLFIVNEKKCSIYLIIYFHFFKFIDNFLYTVHQLSAMKMPLNKKLGMIPIGIIGTIGRVYMA
ncbi:hypothetical protein C0J52_17685, partial [Blattella germanica]